MEAILVAIVIASLLKFFKKVRKEAEYLDFLDRID